MIKHQRGGTVKGETKEQRFKRIAEKRVQLVLEGLRKLSQCANTRMYRWNDEQLEKIWSVIGKELEKCKHRFGEAESEEFKL